jgi:hypothetical protein
MPKSTNPLIYKGNYGKIFGTVLITNKSFFAGINMDVHMGSYTNDVKTSRQ